jgi:hypothetical protein
MSVLHISDDGIQRIALCYRPCPIEFTPLFLIVEDRTFQKSSIFKNCTKKAFRNLNDLNVCSIFVCERIMRVSTESTHRSMPFVPCTNLN